MATSTEITRRLLIILAIVGFGWSSTAEARRAALVIGNSTYANGGQLANPANDARLVASAAQQAGFEVTVLSNLDRASFEQSLRDFRQKADGAEVAMIYYAGHGMEGQGKNWLIPTDAKLAESRDLPFESIDLDRLYDTLSGAQFRIVLLDACRDNPFGSGWQSGVRSIKSGLNAVEVDGVLVIFAAAAGQKAKDGTSGNSPFATSLAQRLPEPGLAVQMLGFKVRDDVLAATGGQQRPFVNASISSTPVYLVEAPRLIAPTAQPAVVATASPGQISATEVYLWQGADAANSAGGFQAYLDQFPTGAFARMARERIARLSGVASAAQPAAPSFVAPAPAVAEAVAMTRAVAPPAAPAPVFAASAAQSFIPAAPSPVFAPASGPLTPSPADFTTAAANASAKGFRDLAPLPVIPVVPLFPKDGYPTCREEYQVINDPIPRINEINRCLSALNEYSSSVLNGYHGTMGQYQDALSRLYTEQVGGKDTYTPGSQKRFYEEIMRVHAQSRPDGAYFAEYRTAEARYKQDRDYLQDRYCFNTGRCGGYAVPAGVAPSGMAPAGSAAPVAPSRK